VRVGVLLACGKHLHDWIISLFFYYILELFQQYGSLCCHFIEHIYNPTITIVEINFNGNCNFHDNAYVLSEQIVMFLYLSCETFFRV